MNWNYDDWYNNTVAPSGQVWSQHDLDLARQHKTFADTIYTAKGGFANAGSQGERDRWHQVAQDARSLYGNYTADRTGQGYISGGPVAQGVMDTLGSIGSYPQFSYGEWENPYAGYQREMLDRVMNREAFEWSKESDPLWGSLKKSHLREGERAQDNALARASAMTGGRPSSYAVTAAGQAGDYYASKLNDMIPQLYGQAYQKYLNEYQMKLSDLNAANSQAALDRSWYDSDWGNAFDAHNSGFNQQLAALGAYSGENQLNKAWGQQEWENRYRTAQLMGEDQRGRQTLAGQQFSHGAEQDKWANQAYLMNMLGQAATPEMAAALGIPQGTDTWERIAGQWAMDNRAAGSGGRAAPAAGEPRWDVLYSLLGMDESSIGAYLMANKESLGISDSEIYELWYYAREMLGSGFTLPSAQQGSLQGGAMPAPSAQRAPGGLAPQMPQNQYWNMPQNQYENMPQNLRESLLAQYVPPNMYENMLAQHMQNQPSGTPRFPNQSFGTPRFPR